MQKHKNYNRMDYIVKIMVSNKICTKKKWEHTYNFSWTIHNIFVEEPFGGIGAPSHPKTQ